MNPLLNVALIQMCSSSSHENNLTFIEEKITETCQAPTDWIALPEYFPIMGMKEKDKLPIVEEQGRGPIQSLLGSLAQKNNVWIFAGSMPIASEDPQRPYGRCLIFNSEGECVTHYDKIHLFDVDVGDNIGSYFESKGTQAGTHPVICETPWGKVGLAICYDLRFPELFRYYAQNEVDFFVIPSAFTEKTGAAHWELLLRARAVENQCFVLAPAQGGLHENGRQTWGHSMVVHPWGNIIAELQQSPGILRCQIDCREISDLRRNMPVHQHRCL